MTGPDYLQFKNELYHHGILGMHWGIRRFQRYPKGYTGDGKYTGSSVNKRNKTEKDIKRRIDRSVKITNKMSRSNYSEYVKNRIASHVRNDHKLFGEKSKEIKKNKARLDEDLRNINAIATIEMRKAVGDSDLRKTVNKRIEKESVYNRNDKQIDKNNGFKEFSYQDVIMNEDNMRKWLPDTFKKLKEIEKHQDDYRKSINDGIDELLKDSKGIGSERISNIKDNDFTYGDIINQIIKRNLTTSWHQRAEGEIDSVIYDELKKSFK